MSTPENIATLRRYIAEPTTATYTDSELSARLDRNGDNLEAVAGSIWTEKAAALAGLVDMSEGNSSRKLSQGYANALKMAASFGVAPTPSTPTTGRLYARSRPIDRV